MKKFLLLCASICLIHTVSIGQNPTYQQKLYYTCKVWGFVKYFHSNVSVCGVNWDSVLIHCLPLVKNAATDSAFNNALDTMLLAAGPMAIATTPTADTMAPGLKYNLNFGWINNTILRADVQTILDTIKNNFRPHNECWVQNNNYTNSYTGWLVFPYDSLILNINDYTNYPDEWNRLLEVFAYWNIINYFNPYNNIHNQPWDSTLYQNIIDIDKAGYDLQFYYAFRKMTSQNDDAHTEGGTYDGYYNFPIGWYSPPLILKYIPNQYVVVKSAVPNIIKGDAIVSINGLTTAQWEDSLRNYISAGDTAVFRRTMSSYMLYGNYKEPLTIVYLDSTNTSDTATAYCDSVYYANWLSLYDYTDGYFPNDTLASVTYRLWNNCNIGYVNMGILQNADVNSMYSALYNTQAIIFDVRDYPNGTAWPIADDIYPNQIDFDNYTVPDVTYPGTFYYSSDYLGANNNQGSYKGKIILLFNEVTQSEAEFSCMILGAMPDVVKIGSQTAGTDGNVSYFRLSQYMQTMFTTLGEFYPNGDSTERKGIIPDSIVYPTREGIRHNRDEVLEKALQVAGCPLAVQNVINNIPSAKIYPNPNEGKFTVSLYNPEGNSIINIYNIYGEKIYSNKLESENSEIDIGNNAKGMYLYRLINENGTLISTGKVILQ